MLERLRQYSLMFVRDTITDNSDIEEYFDTRYVLIDRKEISNLAEAVAPEFRSSRAAQSQPQNWSPVDP